MCTKLTRLLSCVLVLVAIGAAQADLVSHWKFEEGEGTQVNDAVGGNHGTAEGNPTWIEGVYGGAMEFHGSGSADGTGDRLNCGNDASLDIGNEVSLALWIRPDAEDPEGAGMETAPLCKALSGMSPSWTFQVRYGWGGPEPYMAFTFNTSPRAWAFVGKNMEQGEWQHIACSFDGSTLICYLNGEETDSTPMNAVTNSSTPVLIGSDGWGSDWIGGIDDVRYYNNYLTAEEIVEAMLDGAGPEVAGDPVPENEATDVSRDGTLSWSAGEFAATHDVYLGTVFEDVNDASRADQRDVLVSEGQDAITFDPGRLDFSQTYFWRVDEVNAAPDNTIFKGQVWSFTVEPFAYPIENVTATSNAASGDAEGPDNTINGSGLDENDLHSTAASDMWLASPVGDDPVQIQYEFDKIYKLHEMLVWNYNVEFELVLGFGFNSVTVEHSTDGVEWTALGDVEFAQAVAMNDYAANTAVDFGGAAVKYVKLTVNSNHGAIPQYGLSEVRFLSIPVQARVPQPASDANEVSVDTVLSWRAGREAAMHEVLLSTDEAAVADGTALVETVEASSYAPADLMFGSAYYWKVNEVNETEAITIWEGSLWSFTTQEFALIDGFEDYDDEDNAIFDTWIDGFVNETSSTVGYFNAPFAERSIVNSGKQSMPLQYDNAAAPFYSEAEFDLGSMDLAAGGATSLRLYVHGEAANEAATLYLAIEDSSGNVAVVTNPDPDIALATEWQAWVIPNSELTAAGVNLSRAAMIYIGLGDRDNPTAGGSGLVFIDDVGFGTPLTGI